MTWPASVRRIEPPGPDAAVFVISVAAELSGLHPQTLRTYERLGLIQPNRTGGGGRRYSFRDVELLREIAELTSSGIGIEGVRRILDLEHRVAALVQPQPGARRRARGDPRRAPLGRSGPAGPTPRPTSFRCCAEPEPRPVGRGLAPQPLIPPRRVTT